MISNCVERKRRVNDRTGEQPVRFPGDAHFKTCSQRVSVIGLNSEITTFSGDS